MQFLEIVTLYFCEYPCNLRVLKLQQWSSKMILKQAIWVSFGFAKCKSVMFVAYESKSVEADVFFVFEGEKLQSYNILQKINLSLPFKLLTYFYHLISIKGFSASKNASKNSIFFCLLYGHILCKLYRTYFFMQIIKIY